MARRRPTNPARCRSAPRLALAAAACAAGLAGLPSSAPAGEPSPPPPSVAHPTPDPVVRPDVLRTLFGHIKTRRVDFVIIGDSNVRNAQVSGHEDGMGRALSAAFGCYATRVDPAMGQGAWGSGIGGISSFHFGPFSPANADAALHRFAFPSGAFPGSYAMIPAGQSVPSNYNAGMVIIDHPINIHRALRYHLTHHRWRTPTTGIIHFAARTTPYENVAKASVPTTNAVPGLSDFAMDIPAGERASGSLWIVPGNLAEGLGSQGPIFMLWQRLEAPDQAAGIAYSPLLYQGGRSARAACEELTNLGPGADAMQEWLRQVTRLQPWPPVVCFHIMHGGNDTGDALPSCGPAHVEHSYLPEGHADNLVGIMNHLRDAWAIAGYPAENLFFLLGPYHPRGDRLEAEVAYEAEWANLAENQPNVIAVRGTMMSTEQEFIDLGWMQSPNDFAHLSVAGYHGWGQATVATLRRAACPPDLNTDGSCDLGDLFIYLGWFFTADRRADQTRDAAVSVEDLFDFLADWFAGC